MTVATSLIPGLDEIVMRGDPRRRSDIARAISELFFQDASKLKPDLVDLFDNLLIDLVPHADLPVRIDLAERFSRLGNAPRHLVGQFARENDVLRKAKGRLDVSERVKDTVGSFVEDVGLAAGRKFFESSAALAFFCGKKAMEGKVLGR